MGHMIVSGVIAFVILGIFMQKKGFYFVNWVQFLNFLDIHPVFLKLLPKVWCPADSSGLVKVLFLLLFLSSICN